MNIKYFFHSSLIIISLFSFEIKAATVNTASQTTQLNFGKVGPGTSTGSIGSTTNTCSPTTGGVVSFGSCVNGSFALSSQNNGLLGANRTFTVFIPSTITTITTNDTQLNFGSVSGCVTMVTPPSGHKGIQCQNDADLGISSQNWTITVIGLLSSISTTQDSTTYTPSYSFYACGCTGLTDASTCAATVGASQCTGSTGKTLSTTLSAQIYKSLSVVEGSVLRFGSVVAGTGGTINQSGSVTGGVIALPSSTRSAGSFTVSGEPASGTTYSFILPSNVTLSCDTGVSPGCSGAANMNATLSFSAGNGSRTLNSSGQDVVAVNGVLTVGNNQTIGSYKGTYTITVNY